MSAATLSDNSLLSLIAQTWQINEPICDARLDFENTILAFLTGSGCVHFAEAADPDPVTARARLQADTSRITISPRTKSVRPLSLFRPHDATVTSLRACPAGGILALMSTGILMRGSADGTMTSLSETAFSDVRALATNDRSAQIGLIVQDSIRVFSIADGKLAQIASAGSVDSAHGIDFSPDGSRLAVCHDNEIAIYRVEDDALRREVSLPESSGATDIRWSPTGRFLTSRMREGGLCTWRLIDNCSQPMTGFASPDPQFDWGPQDRFLASSGGYRVLCWPLESARLGTEKFLPLETGRKGLVLVTAVAAQTKRDIVAAGYGNGIVIITQAGKPDEMVVRGPEGGAVTTLKWTSDGFGLAIGTADGFAAMARFPEFLFK